MLTDSRSGRPLNAAHDEGYELAEDLLETLGLPETATCIDIDRILDRLDIASTDVTLRTDSIRGVAIAGERYGPAILVNTNSPYNRNTAGRRFSRAHELCHILYDRGHAKRITHTSGRWASPGIERRANAFAAMFLMPRPLLHAPIGGQDLTLEKTIEAAGRLRVGVSALIEHLYDMGLIDEPKRDELRDPARGGGQP